MYQDYSLRDPIHKIRIRNLKNFRCSPANPIHVSMSASFGTQKVPVVAGRFMYKVPRIFVSTCATNGQNRSRTRNTFNELYRPIDGIIVKSSTLRVTIRTYILFVKRNLHEATPAKKADILPCWTVFLCFLPRFYLRVFAATWAEDAFHIPSATYSDYFHWPNSSISISLIGVF